MMPVNSVAPDEPDVVPIPADDEVRSRGLLSQIEGWNGTQQQRRLIEFYEIYQASSSPFPPPEVLQEYDRFSPGKGERLQDVHPRPADPPVMPPFSAIWPPRLRRRNYSIEQFPLLPCPERYINNRQPRDRNSHQTSCQTANDRHRQQSSQNKHESHPPPLRLCFAVGNLLLPFHLHCVFGQLPFHLHFVVVSLHMLVDQLRRCAGMKIIVRTESLRGRKRASPLGLSYPCCPRLSRECLCELRGEVACRDRRVVLFR